MQADTGAFDILLVDDDENDFLLTRRLVDLVGDRRHRVDWVSSYDLGLAAIRRGTYQICLLDNRLGHQSGLALLRQAIKEGCTVPLVLLTGYDDAGVEKDALAAGAADYLVKGKIDAEALERALRHAVERTRARDALRERDQLFHAVFASTLDAMLILDDASRCVDGNPAALALLGLSETALSQKTVADLLTPAEAAASPELWERFLAQGALEGERHIVAAGNRVRTVEFSAKANILPSRHLARMRDVTETKRLRAAVAQADRMASVGVLAACIAHEINNPLAAAIGNIELAEKATARAASGEASPEELARAQADLHSAAAAAERVRRVAQDLALFARPVDARKGPVEVRAPIESTLRVVSNEIRHRARLVVEYADTPTIDASAGRLGQVLLNVLLNAAQAIPEGNADANEIRVATRAEEGRVIIEIRDTGSGIPAADVEKIFEPFYTTKSTSAGLGLSICRSIVTDLGGEISADSTIGRGTTVRISLPVGVLARAPGPVGGSIASDAARRGRILVVDDEPAVIRIFTRMLSAHHEVVGVMRAAEALDLIVAGEAFDVIVSDMMMPQMTGMDSYEALERVAPAMTSRILFVTGGAFTPSARRFLERADVRWLEKPCSPEALVAAVAEVLGMIAAGKFRLGGAE